MELLNQEEINCIVNQVKTSQVSISSWSIGNYAETLIGYLGEHLKLTIVIDTEGTKSEMNFFVKCMPRFDQWKASYLKELTFFKKEYVMLGKLFKKFRGTEESKWRPKLLFIKEDLFVFEDVAELGYRMPSHLETLGHSELMATVQTLAKFHAQSYMYEENKTRERNRPYRIWEDYSDYLQEPPQGQAWRDTGRNAAVDFLKVFSKYKSRSNFSKRVENIMPRLFEDALALMKPSHVYRNAVVHRDLWSNNIFLKKNDSGDIHTLIIDFQTVIYCSPMLDLSSLVYFNTNRSYRNDHTHEILDFYYEVLSKELKSEGIEINKIFKKTELDTAYQESIIFGITQAAIIVPIIAMSVKKREELFSNPATAVKVNVVSRSEEFIEIAREDNGFRSRVTELLDEIVERYVYPNSVSS